MDELLAKYMLGEANANEIKLIEDWVNTSEANQKYFAHFKEIWDTAGKLKTESQLDVDVSWKEFKQMAQNHKTDTKVTRLNMGWLKIAAMLLLGVGAMGILYKMFKPAAPQMLTLHAMDKVCIDTLSDGSIITLNKNSLISVPEEFTGDTRQISLIKGEAFFDIAPDKAKPFMIRINDAVVKVVGTSFNIKKGDVNTEVVVETGIVQVIKQKVMVRLKPKERANIDTRSGKVSKGVSTDNLYSYYRTGQLIADKTPLWRVVQVLNEAYNTNIMIADKRTARLPLTTTLTIGSLEQNLAVIRETFNLQTVRKDGKITIK